MSSSGPKWEDLRREARRLENEIDVKLVTFSKLSSGLCSPEASDKQPLLEPDGCVESVESEIEQLLSNLTEVNDQMCSCVDAMSTGAAMLHTQQRHRDILHDYSSEFQRTKSNVQQTRARRELLASRTRSTDTGTKSTGISRRMDHLLKEHEHIRNSDRLIDEQIAIALETREQLNSQRTTFKAIQTRVNDLTHRFPMINSLMQRIHLRKRRDTIVLAAVVALCLIFFIWHLFG